MLRRIDSLNGVTIAYAMAVANCAMACLLAFGVTITDSQDAAVLALTNALLVLLAHVAHSQASKSVPSQPPPAGTA